MSQLIKKDSPAIPVVGTVKNIVTNVGPDVTPDILGNIAVGGGANITTDGTIPNTVEIRISGTTDHAVQLGNATGSLTSAALGLDNQVLKGNTGANPSWGAVDLTSDVSGLLPVGSGGTGVGTLTDHGVLVGSGVAAVDALAVGTDGQVLLGATGADPAFTTLTSTDGTVVFTPGANTLDLSASSANIPQDQIYYVGKHGNDANSGRNIEQAVLTFGQAIVLATAAVPSAVNKFSITCLDDGIYAEALTVPQWVDIFAPSATLNGTLVVNDDSTIKFSQLLVADAAIGILKSAGTSYTNVEIDIVDCDGGGVGLVSLAGFVNMTWKEMYVQDGFGIGDITSAMGHVHIKGGDIYITGTGSGIARANTGSILGRVDHIADIGAGVGTGILVLDGSVDINVNTLDNDTAYSITGATSFLNLYANTITGTRTVAAGGTVNIWVPPLAMTDGQLVIGSTGTDPVVASLTSTGSTITITPGAGTLNVDTAASVATSYLTDDANSAVPVLGVLTVAGGTNIGSTSGGSTVTLNLDAALTGIDSVTNTNTALAINTGTGTIGLSTDASATTVNLATGGAVKTTTLGSSNGASITTVDCGTGGATFGATANEHTTTVGSTNAASATTVQSGSGALNVTATGGALTINSGVGTLSISSDASAATVNIATGGAAKVVTLGSTNGASSLALKMGTADFNIASATGTVMNILDTGEVTKPLQPAFFAYLPSDVLNVTGAGSPFQLGSGTALTEIFDINSDFNVNGTFTAPVTGKYYFNVAAVFLGTTAPILSTAQFVASNRILNNSTRGQGATTNYPVYGSCFVDMDAGDTMIVNVLVDGDAGNTADAQGNESNTWFSGYLVC